VDASTVCQLRCRCCPTALGEIRAGLGSGFLTLAHFRQIVDGSGVQHVELASWGEVFLNPHLVGILEHADRRNIRLTIDGGANLNHLPMELADAIVRYRLYRLTCAIDGASQETYAKYRRGGSLKRVLENIDGINDAKSRHHSRFPILRWQFVIFGHNEHEIPAAKAMARTLGMEILFKLNWAEKYSPVRDADFVREHTGLAAVSRSEHRQLRGERYRQKLCCAQLWNMPAINWDGRVLGCSVNRWGDFGVVEHSLADAVNSEKIAYARQMLLGRAAARQDIPCTLCHNYRQMEREKNWLRGEEIESLKRELPVHDLGFATREQSRGLEPQ
jgi:MoaA/NifB/PqqE/SkfB family radical SAM enzyme